MRLFVFILLAVIFCLGQSCKEGANSSSDDVLPNGYKFTKHTNVQGPKPVAGEVVTLDFELIDDKGTVLDDSRLVADNTPSIKIPETLSPTMERNPLLAMVRYMTVGDSATVIVPTDSLPNPPDNFKKSAFISYVIKLKTIEEQSVYEERTKQEKLEMRAAAKFKEEAMKSEIQGYFDNYMAGKYKGSTKTMDNGLKIAIIENTDEPKAQNGDFVSVQYFGFLKDGSSFDNSYRAGRPFTFKIGQGMAIKGWDLGIPEVPKNAKAMLEIPYELAYGAAGNPPVIPAKSDLYFYINVEKINNN